MKIENKDYKKLYEEALERAKYWAEGKCMNDFYDSPQNVLNFVFPELIESEDEKIRKWIINEIKIKHHNLDEDNVDFVDKAIVWLEKQGEQSKKVSIWKHLNKGIGIVGIGDGAPTYLIKNGTTYSLSSCLSFECDYIELSELDNLMVEKQCEQKPTWSEEDEKMLTLCASSVRTRYNDGLLTDEEYEQASSWLKSLKDRITLTNKNDFDREGFCIK